MKKEKKNYLMMLLVFLSILLIGLSYAFYAAQIQGKKDQSIRIGDLNLILNETSEAITITNAVGILDEDGYALEGTSFQLENNGGANVSYELYLDDIPLLENEGRLSDEYLKYSLTKNSEMASAKYLTSRMLDSGVLQAGDVNQYNLKLWITAEVDGNYSGMVFRGKLRVEVKQTS